MATGSYVEFKKKTETKIQKPKAKVHAVADLENIQTDGQDEQMD